MFRKAADKKQNAPVVEKDTTTNKTKPIFPAYAPSHLQVNRDDNDKRISKDMYEANQLYVTNLPNNTNMAEISNLFPECVGIALNVNDESESHAAYLEFKDPESTERACRRSRGASLRGNTLIIAPKLKYK